MRGIQATVTIASLHRSTFEVEVARRSHAAPVEPVVPDAGDQLTLSPRAAALRADRVAVSRALEGAYEALAAPAVDFEVAGRSDYLASVSGATDMSPQATAGRILGGITGYIYGAFRNLHPEATRDELDAFHAAVTEGFERGLAEANDVLQGLYVMTDDLSRKVAETTRLVRAGLAEFYANVAEAYPVTRAAA